MARLTRSGERIAHDGRTLTPVARSFLLHAPAGLGGFVWNRPAGVLVEESGERRWLPVRDTTRRLQWGLLAAGLAGAFLVRRLRRPRRRFFRRRRLPRWLR